MELSAPPPGPDRAPPPGGRSRPVVVQHSAGRPGANGPLTAVQRVLASPLAERYEFVRMHQDAGNGGVDASLLREWVRLLRRTRPDLVHVRGLQNEGFHGVLAARLAGCPRILVTVHGTVRDLRHDGRSWRRRLLTHGAEPATLRMASHVATVCEYAAGRDFLRPYARKFVGVIPNGVPVPRDPTAARERMRAQLDLRPGDVAMIAVSRLTWDKGYGVLADALRRLPVGGARRVLLVAGDGPDRAGIAAALSGADGTEVRLLGNRLDVPDLLAAADVFVFPTLHENMSNALLEAMAHGLPVVASAVGGNLEVLRSGGGRLVPAGDPDALAAALAGLLDEPGERRHLGQLGHKVAGESYSLDVMLRALDGVYQRMLRR
ncbi:glycosyltransferase family 4 protein [Micromonospora sp. NPDC049051]|uniref:glycosyltransferase family 4 protein n=1 Tax=Micromonospora sp. NPDC049051 TaxID=3364264 RepID=UPI00371105D2